MKRKLSFLIAVLLIIVSVLSGCSSSKSTASAGKQNTSQQTNTVTPAVAQQQSSSPTVSAQQNSSAADSSQQSTNASQAVKANKTESKTAVAVNSAKKTTASSQIKNSCKINIGDAIKGASEYIKNASAKSMYKINDWDAIALKVSGYDILSKEFKVNNMGYIDYKAQDFIKNNSSYYLTDYARSYLGIAFAGYDPSNFMGYDITDIIKNSTSKNGNFLDTVNGGDDLINCHVWSMIALEAGKVNYDRAAALKYIESHQNKDGGFYIFSSFPQSDIDFTAMTVIALDMAGRDKSSASVSAALNYLKKQTALMQKNPNGETAETLSAILQAVVASKDDVNKYIINGKNLADELLTFYTSSGAFKHIKSGSGNAIATRQALTALVSYKNNRNIYSDLSYKNGNFYNAGTAAVSSIKIHNAVYDSSTGMIEISAAVDNADSISLDIYDGVNSYTDNIIPKDNIINFNKTVPNANYNIILKTIKNGNVTSVFRDTLESVNKQANASVRIEGYDKTIIKSLPLTAGNCRVYDYDGNSFTTPVLSAYTFVMKALIGSNIQTSVSYSYGPPYIAGINGVLGGKFGGWDGWMYYINGKDPGVGMSDAKISDGDEILVYYGDFGIRPLDIEAADSGKINEFIPVKVTCDGNPIEGASVYANGKTYITDASGTAFVQIPDAGVFEIYSEKNDASGKPLFIRSRRVNITINK